MWWGFSLFKSQAAWAAIILSTIGFDETSWYLSLYHKILGVMADRRRVNGPTGSTVPPIYDYPSVTQPAKGASDNVIRKICKF